MGRITGCPKFWNCQRMSRCCPTARSGQPSACSRSGLRWTVDELLVDWEEALRENGYAIGRGRDEPLEGLIEFNGTGIVNAKIILAPAGDDGPLIEIDATLR